HRYECGAAGILPVDKPIDDGLFTSCQLDTWLILTCAMPAGWPEVGPPVGRDLSCHLLTPAFAARKLHQNRVGRAGSGLERSAGGRAVRVARGHAAISSVQVWHHRVSAGRRSSSDPGRAGRPTAGCRETAATR